MENKACGPGWHRKAARLIAGPSNKLCFVFAGFNNALESALWQVLRFRKFDFYPLKKKLECLHFICYYFHSI